MKSEKRWRNRRWRFAGRCVAVCQVDGFGNAVSPAVGTWIGARLRAILHGSEAVA